MSKVSRVIYHILSVAILVASILIGVFSIRYGFLRLYEGILDFGLAVGTWFCTIFGIDHDFVSGVNSPSSIDFSSIAVINEERLRNYCVAFVDPENIMTYFGVIGKILLLTMPIMWLFFIVGLILFKIIKSNYLTENNDYGKETWQLRVWKRISLKLYQPVKRFILGYVSFLSGVKIYVIMFIAVWSLSTNLATVPLEFLAYVLNFSVTLDVYSFPTIIVKLLLDLAIFFRYCPFVFWLAGAMSLFSYVRRKIGIQRLENIEAKNEELLGDLPVVTLFVGKMGTGKDLSMTTLALTESVRFRNLAHERLVANDLKFPFFPWILFEIDLRKAIESHVIYSKYTAGVFADNVQRRFEANPIRENLYMYDFVRYGMTYDDGLTEKSLFDVLKVYAQLYYIYCFSTSLIVSNHAIREDLICIDYGNFPQWTVDFFRSTPRESAERSLYAHVLDFDMVRLGKLMVENNIYRNAAEFGIFIFSEAGKDRGNQFDHMRVEKGGITIKQLRKIFKKYEKYEFVGRDEIFEELAQLEEEKCTPLSDYFNLMLKMFRHMATVDGICFVSMFMNDQREQCLNADARELCDVVILTKKSLERNVLPFNVYDEIIRDMFYKPFRKIYDTLRVIRGDHTLLVHALKTFVSVLERHWVRLKNTFEYYSVSFTREDGRMNTKADDKIAGKIHICKKMVFADRYATDCFGGYFDMRAAKSPVGLCDVPTFTSSKATWEELRHTNGHFINVLQQTFEESDHHDD